MHPSLGRKTALTSDLPQIHNTFVSGGVVRNPLPFYSFLENVFADTPVSMVVAHTSAKHRTGSVVLPVGSVYSADFVMLTLNAM